METVMYHEKYQKVYTPVIKIIEHGNHKSCH